MTEQQHLLRWGDVFTSTQRDSIRSQIAEALQQLVDHPESRNVLKPVMIASEEWKYCDNNRTFVELAITSDGLRAKESTFHSYPWYLIPLTILGNMDVGEWVINFREINTSEAVDLCEHFKVGPNDIKKIMRTLDSPTATQP